MILGIKDEFLQLIRKDFDKSLEVDKRILVISDLEMFRKGEDSYVWKQSKGKVSEVFQVYFDNEHICNFKADDIKEAVYLMFWKGFKEKYSKGLIHLDQLWKIREREVMEEEIKKAEKTERHQQLKDSVAITPEEKMAKDLALKMEEI